MSFSGPLRLGTRGSELALWQARRVAGLIEKRLKTECTIEIVKTRGDRVQDVAFHKMEGKGFFTKELQDALIDGHVDLVVHSLKDLPTSEPPGLEIIAIPERGDPTDMLLARSGLLTRDHAHPLGLPAGAVLGTSSLRRAAQALASSPRIEVRALRGNVPTRVRKLRNGEYDAIVVATAGVRRLGLEIDDLDWVELTPEVMLPAPGQGALAVEARAGDAKTVPLTALHDPIVGHCVRAERHLLEQLGGGCHMPLGCLASVDESGVRLQAVLGRLDDGISEATISRVGSLAQDPETAARVCYEALRLAMPEAVGA
jgi:hydroxymethylbilane synthase